MDLERIRKRLKELESIKKIEGFDAWEHYEHVQISIKYKQKKNKKKMYVEITKELFKVLVTSETTCNKVTKEEPALKQTYIVKGVTVVKVTNYSNYKQQYYIKDINY